MRRKVTIEDIARRSNASPTTVSLVLRDLPGIGEETRRRVWAAAQELGYQRRPTAPKERPQSVLNVGLILRSRRRAQAARLPGVNPFYSWVLAGAEAEARAQRMNLLYTTLPVAHDNQAIELPSHVLAQPLDGILLIGSFTDETIGEITGHSSAALVLVDAPAGSDRHDAVISDNIAGAQAAVRYLIERGHRRIALIAPRPEADPNYRQRRDGYLTVMRQHGLTAYADPAPDYDATTATTTLLHRHSEVTAIFACSDALAIEALRAAEALGRRVPDDLSVIGFDDIELAAQISPTLTTMAVDKVTMGRIAVQTLAHRLAWPDAAKILTVLRPELIERESVAGVLAPLETSETDEVS